MVLPRQNPRANVPRARRIAPRPRAPMRPIPRRPRAPLRPTTPQPTATKTPPKKKNIFLIIGISIGSLILIALIIAILVALNNSGDGCNPECDLFEKCHEEVCVNITTTENCGEPGNKCEDDEYCNGDLRCATLPTLPCVPETCSSLGKECGIQNDGCWESLNCGSCETDETCSDGKCIDLNECNDTCSSLGKECRNWIICGKWVDCGIVTGGCESDESCNSTGQCVANISCIDSDNGKYPNTLGTNDTCNGTSQVNEWWCNNGTGEYELMDCSSGNECSQGACAPIATTCTNPTTVTVDGTTGAMSGTCNIIKYIGVGWEPSNKDYLVNGSIACEGNWELDPCDLRHASCSVAWTQQNNYKSLCDNSELIIMQGLCGSTVKLNETC